MITSDSNPLGMSAGRKALAVGLLCAGYYLGTLLGYALIFPESYISVIWPPNTLLLAALLLSAPRHWVWLLAAVLPVHLFAQARHGTGLSMAFLYYVHDCAVVPLPAYVLRRFGLARMDLGNLRDALAFVLVVTLATAAGALVWSPIIIWLWIGGELWTPWSLAFLSNYVPYLIAIPCMIIGLTRGSDILRNAKRRQWAEFGLMTVGMIICGIVLFSIQAGSVSRMPALLYAPLPLLLWAAVRFGPGGLSLSCLIFSLMAIYNASTGFGPLVAQSAHDNVLWLQVFLLALYVPLLMVAAVVKEQRAKQEALKESEARYRGVVEDQTELICRFLPDGTYTFVNDAYCRYFKCTPEHLLGRTFWEFIPTESHEASRKLLASITAQAPSAEIEHEVIIPGAGRRWQHWIDRALFDDDGRIVAFQAVGRDITDRRETDEALRAALGELRQMKDRLQAENAYLHEELSANERVGDVVCKSRMMRQTLAQVQRVAPTETTVLILGETGVGKEVIARTIHRTSNRKDKAFIRLNCAALPANLIESELFGHERGAFTGAAARRLGRFEVANGATLFLDEIGELPLEVQVKLLRVLQENEFERLGSSETIKVDVRLIAATSRDLAACARNGSFRPDLYYRLNVFPIDVPPLRMRKEDIVPLASTFLEQAGQRLSRIFAPINVGTAQSLLEHDWPGNVRELENVIERSAICSPGDVLLLSEGWNKTVVSPTAPDTNIALFAAENHSNINAPNAPLNIHDLERTHIVAVLESTRWRIEGPHGAAVLLGIKPSTLRFRMKKLSISRDVTKALSQ